MFQNLKKLRPRSGYDVVAVLSMCVAVGTGGAYAATIVTGADIVDESITDADIKNGSLGAAIPDVSIGHMKLAPSGVWGSNVLDGSLTTDDVADNNLTGQDVADATLSAADVADGSLGGADLSDGSVTAAELAADSVSGGSGGDVKDGSITGADVSESSLAKVPAATLHTANCAPTETSISPTRARG